MTPPRKYVAVGEAAHGEPEPEDLLRRYQRRQRRTAAGSGAPSLGRTLPLRRHDIDARKNAGPSLLTPFSVKRLSSAMMQMPASCHFSASTEPIGATSFGLKLNS